MRQQRLELYRLPDYKPRVGRFNQWGYDPPNRIARPIQAWAWISMCMTSMAESPGSITDRSRENLAGTDIAISRYRAMLLRSMDKAASTEANDDLPCIAQQERRPLARNGMTASWMPDAPAKPT